MAKSGILRRIEAIERAIVPPKRLHVLWWDLDETDAELEARKSQLIASGEASRDDDFVKVTWKRVAEAESSSIGCV